MPDLKISQLPVATTPLAGTELVPIVQGGVTDQTTVQAIMTSTVPSGTANGVLYLNGSKVATSGTDLVFNATGLGIGTSSPGYKLDVQGASGVGIQLYETSTGNNNRLRITQTAGITNYQTTFSNSSTNAQTWTIGGSELMRIDSTGLGIGTSSPGYRLTAAGASTAGSVTALAIENPSTNAASEVRQEWRAGGSSWSYITTSYNSNSPYMAFGVSAASSAPTERMRLDSSGNLGIGTSSPQSRLHSYSALGTAEIVQDAATAFRIVANNGTNYIQSGTALSSDSKAPLVFSSMFGVTEWMRLDSSGNLGIGTSSPSRKLDVQGAPVSVGGNATGVLANFVNNTTAFNASPTVAISLWNRYNSGGSTFPSAVVQAGKENATDGNFAGYLSLQTTDAGGTSTERARITSTGNVVAGGSVALATNATDGFLYVPTCAGIPTGTPTAITGMAPIVVDTTNNKMYFYSGGAWRDAGP